MHRSLKENDVTSAACPGSARSAAADREELHALRELSVCVGTDPLLTQGSSGNCSIKSGGILWIKGSGKWMCDARSEDFLLPLSLRAVQHAVARGIEPADEFPGASLETALHATMPHRVVLHIHSVNTIAWAVRIDAAERLPALMRDLAWRWIPYTPSGLALSQAVQESLIRRPDADVFVLGKHGLAIGADDTDGLEEILAGVERRLAVEARPSGTSELESLRRLCAGTSWEAAREETVHALATDSLTREILARGLLVPSQGMLADEQNAALFRPAPRNLAGSTPGTTPFLIVENQGVLVRRNAPRGSIALLSGLVEVARRIPSATLIRYLTEPETRELSSPRYRNYRERAGGAAADRLGS